MCQHLLASYILTSLIVSVPWVHVLFLRLGFVCVCISSWFLLQACSRVARHLQCPVWALGPSVGRGVMVGLRRTQEAKPLLVLPLFCHLWRTQRGKKDINLEWLFILHVEYTWYENLFLCYYCSREQFIMQNNVPTMFTQIKFQTGVFIYLNLECR